MAVKIMGDAEFEKYYEATKKELAYMEPGDTKRIALIGAVEGAEGCEIAFTGAQLRKIFDLGFREEVPRDEKDVRNLPANKTGDGIPADEAEERKFAAL